MRVAAAARMIVRRRVQKFFAVMLADAEYVESYLVGVLNLGQ